MAFCASCGTERREGEANCPTCGARHEPSPPTGDPAGPVGQPMYPPPPPPPPAPEMPSPPPNGWGDPTVVTPAPPPYAPAPPPYAPAAPAPGAVDPAVSTPLLPPNPPGLPSPPTTSGNGGRRGVLAVVAVVLVLAVVAGVVTTFLLGRDDDTAADPTEAGRSPSSDANRAADEDQADDVPDVAGEVSSSAAPEDLLACWDGTTRATCPAIAGTSGLAWVFPAADGDECYAKTPEDSARVQTRWCDTDDHRIHYTQWREWDAMDAYYRQDALSEIDLRDDVHAYETSGQQGFDAKIAVWFVRKGAPFSVTIYADSVQRARQLFDDLDVRGGDAVVSRGTS